MALPGHNKPKSSQKNKKTSIGHGQNTRIRNKNKKRIMGKCIYRGQGK